MARAKFVKAARKDIYQKGIRIPAENKQGFTLDRSTPNPDGDTLIVKAGESYYWWKFRHGGKRISKTPPQRSQLTQSDFKSTIWTIEDERIAKFVYSDGRDAVEEIIGELEELRDQCQESLDNMPESLQESPTGEMLQNRIDSLEDMIGQLEDVDFDSEPDREDFDTRQAYMEALEQYQEEVEEEVKGVTYDGE